MVQSLSLCHSYIFKKIVLILIYKIVDVPMSQDYLKSALPSQIISERGSNLVVINPGMLNIQFRALPICHPLPKINTRSLNILTLLIPYPYYSGSANVRIGLASQDTPFNIHHCIARHTKQTEGKVIDQVFLRIWLFYFIIYCILPPLLCFCMDTCFNLFVCWFFTFLHLDAQ